MSKTARLVAATPAVAGVCVLALALLASACADDSATGPGSLDDLVDLSTSTSTPTSTTTTPTTLPPLPLEFELPARTPSAPCLLDFFRFGQPLSADEAEVYVTTARAVSQSLELNVQDDTRAAWDRASRGALALAAALEVDELDDRAFDEINFFSPEFAADPVADEWLREWCEAAHPIAMASIRDVGHPPVNRPSFSGDTPPGPCAGATTTGFFGGDDVADWILAIPSEPDPAANGVTRFVICDSGRPFTYEFEATMSGSFQVVDHDRDGIDAMVLVEQASGIWDVWHRPLFKDRLERLVHDGSPLSLDATGPNWFGCADINGDGQVGLAFGSVDSKGWEGLEVSYDYSGQRPSAVGEGAGEPPASCTDATPWRPADPAICSGRPSGGLDVTYEELESFVTVETGDILVTLHQVIEVWRDGEMVGHVDANGSFGRGRAFHDGAGGVVVEHVVLEYDEAEIVHFSADGGREVLYRSSLEFDDDHDVYRLQGVTMIDDVATLLIVRRTGAWLDLTGELVLHPLDGSPVRTLPSHDYYEGGTEWFDWDGERFIIIEGGEGSVTTRAIDADGGAVEYGWNVFPEWMGPDRSLQFAIDGEGTVWSSIGTGYGQLLQQRKPSTGDVIHEVWAEAAQRIEIAPDGVLVSGWSDDACHRIYNPETGSFTPIRQGGWASVA